MNQYRVVENRAALFVLDVEYRGYIEPLYVRNRPTLPQITPPVPAGLPFGGSAFFENNDYLCCEGYATDFNAVGLLRQNSRNLNADCESFTIKKTDVLAEGSANQHSIISLYLPSFEDWFQRLIPHQKGSAECFGI